MKDQCLCPLAPVALVESTAQYVHQGQLHLLGHWQFGFVRPSQKHYSTIYFHLLPGFTVTLMKTNITKGKLTACLVALLLPFDCSEPELEHEPSEEERVCILCKIQNQAPLSKKVNNFPS